MNADEINGRRHPQIKICGLTQPQEAASCAAGGADAIGYIFYPPSPRSIAAVLGRRVDRWGLATARPVPPPDLDLPRGWRDWAWKPRRVSRRDLE